MEARQKFEALPEIQERLHTVVFNEQFNNYHAAMINSGLSVCYVQGAWMAFQEQEKKVKELDLKIKRLRLIMMDYYTGSFDESEEMAGLISEVLLDESKPQ